MPGRVGDLQTPRKEIAKTFPRNVFKHHGFSPPLIVTGIPSPPMNPDKSPRVGRRQFLKGSTATVLAGALPAAQSAPPSSAAERKKTLIAEENEKPGALDWQLTRVRIQHVAGGAPNEGYRSPWIEGYARGRVVAAGETIDIMVSTNPAARFKIEIFRSGYYGGRGARHMTTLGPFEGKPQADAAGGRAAVARVPWEAARR